MKRVFVSVFVMIENEIRERIDDIRISQSIEEKSDSKSVDSSSEEPFIFIDNECKLG